MILTILAFVATLGFLILIHEGGHFLAARRAGVWVHEFAIGFGPAIWKRRGKETVYALRLFPIGGYVRMAGDDEPASGAKAQDSAVPPDRLFSAKSPWARMAIIGAGPLTNIGGAVALMVLLVAVVGVPYVEVVDFTGADTPAASVLQVGDKIVRINGQAITSTAQIQRLIQSVGERPVTVEVLRGGERLSLQVTPRWEPDQGRFLIGAFFSPTGTTNLVRRLRPNSSLARAGLRPGDRLLELDGIPIASYFAFHRALTQVKEQGQSQASLTVERAGRTVTLALDLSQGTPEEVLAGLQPEILTRRPGPLSSVAIGVGQIRDMLVLMYRGIRSIFAGQVSPGEALSGPVGIAGYIGKSLQQGWLAFFQLVAILSLNLGIINLFPFPALDGSRLGFISYELLRGKPIPPEREGLIHQIGFMVLIGLILLITYNDILKLFR